MFHILKSEGDQRLVFGWASVSVTVDGEQIEDLEGDAIDPEELEKAAYQYVLDFRDAGEMHDQGLRKKARLVESCVFTPEKLKAMRIPEGTVPLGWWVGFYVDDDEAWEKIKDGSMTPDELQAVFDILQADSRDAAAAIQTEQRENVRQVIAACDSRRSVKTALKDAPADDSDVEAEAEGETDDEKEKAGEA